MQSQQLLIIVLCEEPFPGYLMLPGCMLCEPAWCTVLRPLMGACDPQLLNVWVEPLVHVNVRLAEGSTAADSAVIIEATNWSLHGSELIESLGLNRRFSLAFQVGAPRADRVLGSR